ncbi:MAG: 16S rRNA (cytosine(967)-C(5))-methyltransferase RsmB [Rhodoferax sp.]|nr:16S rRNA (cytosine(967)-C(5))-methyltransferase RsmB [Rhodoferax sp.]
MNTPASPGAPPLWRQLNAVATVLVAIRAGESGTAALNHVEPGLRPGVQALVFHVLRWLGRSQALRQLLAKRAPPAQADALLCSALALAWREEGALYDAFTLVDQTVEAAKRHPDTRRQASFINACLRRFLRERAALVAATDSDPVAVWNHPRWWIARLQKDHPAHWQEILRANNTHAPMTLRVNTRKVALAQYLNTLRAANIIATQAGQSGVVLHKAMLVGAIPGFTEGQVSVQDAAAQRAAPLLLAGWEGRRDLHILDACAAPGGKTAHLLELADGARVTALDIDPARCERIHQTLQRLGLHASVIAADAMKPQTWWPQQCRSELFDAILLDAPCTASGIVRRHPDVRWLRRESDIAQLAAIQAALLAALWPLLKPGGRLLYCTCSVFKAEGYDQIQTFVTHNTDAVLRPSPGHLMPQIGANGDAVPDNQAGDHDGFFYALLEKRAA